MPLPNLLTRLICFSATFLTLVILILPGCDSDGRLMIDANPTGYYTDIGVASVRNGTGETIIINDLQAMVLDGEFRMMSVSGKFLYDGIITNISGNDFTADFTVFADGKESMPITANGTITEGSKIEGTLIGNGVGSGTFSLFSVSENEQADIADSINDLQKILDANQN